MTTAAKDNNGKPVLSTWQWLTVVIVILGGMVGLDQRMQATVRVFAESNDRDHVIIRGEINDIARNIPPSWFEKRVTENTTAIAKLQGDLASLRVSIAELTAAVRSLQAHIDEMP